MKVVHGIGIVIALLAGVVLIGGQLLPGKLEISREEHICHPPARVFEALSTPGQIARWSLFTREAEIPVTHGGAAGPGGWVSWKGDDSDSIEWRIEETDPPRTVEYVINLDDSVDVYASGNVRESEDSAEIRMTLRMEPETIFGRWGMMLMVWLPGNQSLSDVLQVSIGHLQSYLAEEYGKCGA